MTTIDLKSLPVGVQSFAILRKEKCIYVDKTADIHRLVTSGRAFFLSRPRRFGKSLLLSTLEYLFKGDKALFQGLAIYDKWDWTQKYPVIRIDWVELKHASLGELRIMLGEYFQYVAGEYGVTLSEQLSDNRFAELIRKVHDKTGQPVVVLVDEYDKLMLDVIDKEDKFAEARDYLRSLYVVLKGMSEHIHFVFLTGVSRFAGLSVFSGLNNLDDITLDPLYATLCGYTQSELEDKFCNFIEAMAKKRNCNKTELLKNMRTWYNGYSWDGETSVYNPYSVLLFLRKQRFGNFWFNTATPSFLLELAKKDAEILTIVDSEKTYYLDAPEPSLSKPSMLSLLFQTGYLTIKTIQELPSLKQKCTLDFPNSEVKDAFLTSLLNVYLSEGAKDSTIQVETMKESLANGDVGIFEEKLNSLLAEIPYSLTSKEKESHYHVIMIVWLHLLGFKMQNEVPTNKGRIDAVLELDDQIIIIEIKLSHITAEATDAAVVAAEREKLIGAAFAQIKEKGYANAYMSRPGKVSQLAIAFYGRDAACRLEVLKEK